MVESCIKIFLEAEMSMPSVLGLLAGESMDRWENVAPSQPFMPMWAPGLLVNLKLLTVRLLQEWKNTACKIHMKNHVSLVIAKNSQNNSI